MSQMPPGYGGPPPGYGGPPPSYGMPMPPPKTWDLGDCMGWAWAKLKDNAGPMMLATAPLLIAIVAVEAVNIVLLFHHTTTLRTVCDTDYSCHTVGVGSFVRRMLVSMAMASVIGFVVQVLAAGIFRGALAVADGARFTLGEAFKPAKLGRVLLTALMVSAAVIVGVILCYVPGIIVGFLLSYSLYFVVATDLSPIAAMKASVRLTKENLGTTVVWYLLGGLIGGAGVLVCGVGLLVSYPFFILGTAYTFRKLTGGPVAP